MSIPDNQLELLQTAAAALHGWQNAAEGVGVVIQQIVFDFPPDGKSNLVQFTWDATGESFNVATLPPGSLPTT